MATFVYPSTAELREIEQEILPALVASDPIFEFFPPATEDAETLIWEQQDNFLGLQQVRGIDGAFARVIKIGAKRYQMDPGYYGEFIDLNETELMRRRQLGTWNGLVNITDLSRSAQDQLLDRRIKRQRQILWTLAATGTFSVTGPSGAVLHTDTYSPQTASAAVAWGTVATATPLVDLRTVQLLGPSRGTSFGSGAKAFMNRTTFNKLVANTNASDLGGRYSVLFNQVRSVQSLNMILAGEDLPQLLVFDDGYYTDAGSFTRFLANDKVVIFGQRPGNSRIGEYRMVRNISNPGMAPGPYTEVRQQPEPPKKVNVYDGHNGGPVIFFPGSIVILTVS